MITGVHHFSIISSSETSVSFYKTLGFKEISRIERSYDTVILFKGPGIQLEMYLDPKHPSHPSSPEPLGIRCISLKTDNIKNTLKELGLENTEISTDWNGQKYCFINDPDNVPIQLHE